MTISLDLGTTELRCLVKHDNQLTARRCPTHYAIMTPEAETIHLLDLAGAKYSQAEGKLVVWGEAGLKIAHTLCAPTQAVMPEGKIPYTNPLARQLLGLFLDVVIPQAEKVGETCTLTGVSRLKTTVPNRELAFVGRAIREKGYQFEVISPGHALGLAELGDKSMTGACLNLGATHTVFSYLRHGAEMFCLHVHRGGHWIDEQFALATDQYRWNAKGQRFLDLQTVHAWKHDASRLVMTPKNEREKILSERYRDLLRHIMLRIEEDLSSKTLDAKIKQDKVPLIVSGGPAQINGFLQLIESFVLKQKLPIPFSSIRLVRDYQWTLARGCMIKSQMENIASQPPQRRAA
jgi:hypothetical protein